MIGKHWWKLASLSMNLIDYIQCGNGFANVWNFKRASQQASPSALHAHVQIAISNSIGSKNAKKKKNK